MVEFDPFTNEEIVTPEDEMIEGAATAETSVDDPDHWFFKHFQYLPINWWI